MTSIAENLASVRARIGSFEQRYARETNSVKLLAVSKKQSIEKIRLAHAAGITDLGENYVQEATEKMDLLEDLELTWHFIGPIQTNKTRVIAERFDWVHAVDREKVARRLSEQRPLGQSRLNVCVQINLSGETSKSGVGLIQAQSLCATIAQLPNLRLRGLMAIPAALTDMASQRECFRELAEEFFRLSSLQDSKPESQFPTMDTLSMGMSNDFESAIAEGSTLVRLGTAIFGARELQELS